MTVFWVALIATVAVGVGTYLMRSSFILALADRDIPPPVLQALRYVAPSVLAALVVSVLYGDDGSVRWIELVALATGGIVGWRTHSIPWVLFSGMAVLWLLDALF